MGTATNNNKKATVAKAGQSVKKQSTTSKSSSPIIETLARAYSVGQDSMTKTLIITGTTSLATKTIQNQFPKLRDQGLITIDGQDVSLTKEGLQAAGDLAHRPTNNDEWQLNLKKDLKAKQVQIFDHLADGKTCTKVQLAQLVGYDDPSAKTFQNLIGSLRGKLGLVEYPTKSTVRLTAKCFLIQPPARRD